MGIQHHAFNCKIIIFFAVYIIISLFFVAPAAAYNSLFIVENVKVDVTAKDSVTAQEQAFEKAQTKAFGVLARRMVDEGQVDTVSKPDSLTISSLIQDYEVTNEQLSAVRYVGTYRFRFRDEAVKKFFSVSGVSFTETRSKTLLVLPVFQKNGKNTIWSQSNLWMGAWSRAQLSAELVPVEVPIGDLDDISDIDDAQALSYKRGKLDRMLGRYNAEEAAIMVAVPDIMLAGLALSDKAAGRLRISIYRTDRARAEFVQDIRLEANGNERVSKFYDRAVKRAFSALQKDWKNKTAVSAAQNELFHLRAPFKSLKQWVKVQNALRATSGISDFSILSVKRTEAFVAFTFRGDARRLRDHLALKGLIMGEGTRNPASQGFTANGRTAPELVYDVGYRRTTQKKTQGAQQASDSFYKGIEPAAGVSEKKQAVHTF